MSFRIDNRTPTPPLNIPEPNRKLIRQNEIDKIDNQVLEISKKDSMETAYLLHQIATKYAYENPIGYLTDYEPRLIYKSHSEESSNQTSVDTNISEDTQFYLSL